PLDELHMSQGSGVECFRGFADATVEHDYDRAWAVALAQKALSALEAEYQQSGRQTLHAKLLPYLTDWAPDGTYATLKAELNTSKEGLGAASPQMRRLFGHFWEAEVAQPAARPDDPEEEFRYPLALWIKSSTNVWPSPAEP